MNNKWKLFIVQRFDAIFFFLEVRHLGKIQYTIWSNLTRTG